jgi:hypothetical protein
MVGKVKGYKEIFNASFAFLVSTQGISEERVRFLLRRPSIKGDVIIAKFIPTHFFNQPNGHIEINSKFIETVPDFLHFWLRPKEDEPKSKPSFVNKIFKHS